MMHNFGFPFLDHVSQLQEAGRRARDACGLSRLADAAQTLDAVLAPHRLGIAAVATDMARAVEPMNGTLAMFAKAAAPASFVDPSFLPGLTRAMAAIRPPAGLLAGVERAMAPMREASSFIRASMEIVDFTVPTFDFLFPKVVELEHVTRSIVDGLRAYRLTDAEVCEDTLASLEDASDLEEVGWLARRLGFRWGEVHEEAIHYLAIALVEGRWRASDDPRAYLRARARELWRTDRFGRRVQVGGVRVREASHLTPAGDVEIRLKVRTPAIWTIQDDDPPDMRALELAALLEMAWLGPLEREYVSLLLDGQAERAAGERLWLNATQVERIRRRIRDLRKQLRN